MSECKSCSFCRFSHLLRHGLQLSRGKSQRNRKTFNCSSHHSQLASLPTLLPYTFSLSLFSPLSFRRFQGLFSKACAGFWDHRNDQNVNEFLPHCYFSSCFSSPLFKRVRDMFYCSFYSCAHAHTLRPNVPGYFFAHPIKGEVFLLPSKRKDKRTRSRAEDLMGVHNFCLCRDYSSAWISKERKKKNFVSTLRGLQNTFLKVVWEDMTALRDRWNLKLITSRNSLTTYDIA